MEKKGQVFTWDLVFASALFMLILSVIVYLWDSTSSEIQDSEILYNVGWYATTIGETLVRTAGSPENWTDSVAGSPGLWNYTNVMSFGLADTQKVLGSDDIQDRLIDPDKFLWFVKLLSEDYEHARYRVLRTGNFDFYIQITCRDPSTSDCFRNLHAPTVGNAVIPCYNGFWITVTNNTTTTTGGPGCVVGKFITPSNAYHMSSTSVNGVFNEPVNVSQITLSSRRKLDKAIEIKVVVYTKVNTNDSSPPIVFNSQISPSSGPPGTEFTIRANIADESGVDSSTTLALIQSPDGNTISSVNLYDDGLHGDLLLGDGVFGNRWNSTGFPEAAYFVDLRACDTLANCIEIDNIS